MMMRKYDPEGEAEPLTEDMVSGVTVVEIVIKRVAGKKNQP